MNAIDILTGPDMQMLYDSDSFVVVHVQPTEGEAPAAPHLPVRIRQTQASGDFADFQLRDAQGSRP